MQNEITKAHNLLSADGTLAESGWARTNLLRYNRENICHPPKRYKEWHYYFCGDETYGIGFFIANVGVMHSFSISFMDFKNKANINAGSICPAATSIMVIPDDAYGSLRYKKGGARCELTGGRQELRFNAQWKNFRGRDTLDLDLMLYICLRAIPFTTVSLLKRGRENSSMPIKWTT